LRSPHHRPTTGRSLVADARLGIAAVRGRRWLLAIITLAGVQGLLAHGPISLALPVLVRSDFGSAESLGLVYAAEAAGVTLGALAAGIWRPRVPGVVIVGGLCTNALVAACLIANEPLILLAAATLVFGAGVGALQVLWNTALQQRIPANLLGRVAAVDYIGSEGLTPLGTRLRERPSQLLTLEWF
jgi:MFS family permease